MTNTVALHTLRVALSAIDAARIAIQAALADAERDPSISDLVPIKALAKEYSYTEETVRRQVNRHGLAHTVGDHSRIMVSRSRYASLIRRRAR